MFSQLVRWMLSAAIFVLFVPAAWATDFTVPDASIVVADTNSIVPPGKPVALGELVDLSVPQSSDKVPFLLTTSYEWKVLEQGREKRYKGGCNASNIWYAAGTTPKKQQVFCVVTYLYVVREKPDDPKSQVLEVATRTKFLHKEVVIGGDVPDVDPVDPPNPPGPTPTPTPPPIAGNGFKVLIVYESADIEKMPADQKSILVGRPFRDYLNDKCAPDGDIKAYRIYDKDVNTSNESKTWQDAVKRARDKIQSWKPRVGPDGKPTGPQSPVPWVIISNGKTGYEGPLPADVAGAIKLCDQYAGK